jgi:ubiquinone/menaquinone biosynthesis C-methylase UbiE
MNVTESMRRDWDDRARKNAFYYIASWRTDWDLSGFLASGEEDYARLVTPALQRAGLAPNDKMMLELGCGAGRMTHGFAKRFKQVIAFDVSSEMLLRARQNLHGVDNVTWLQGNGIDLRNAPNESVDFVFSYLVLQHLPKEELVRTYIREMHRVLKPEGICLFQFNGMRRPTMNWRGQILWSFVDALWSVGLEGVSRFAARVLGFDPQMAGKSWHGIAMSGGDVLQAVKGSGGTVLELTGQDSPMAWCCTRREAPSQNLRSL